MLICCANYNNIVNGNVDNDYVYDYIKTIMIMTIVIFTILHRCL